MRLKIPDQPEKIFLILPEICLNLSLTKISFCIRYQHRKSGVAAKVELTLALALIGECSARVILGAPTFLRQNSIRLCFFPEAISGSWIILTAIRKNGRVGAGELINIRCLTIISFMMLLIVILLNLFLTILG